MCIRDRYYGEEPKPQIQTIRPEIDEAWFALGRAAKEMGMPMLGICKGIQFLNVLCGGDLYQDIYTQKETTILHLQSLEPVSYTHLWDASLKQNSFSFCRRIRNRNCGKQCLRIRMHRIAVNFLFFSDLHEIAEIHNADTVTDVFHVYKRQSV